MAPAAASQHDQASTAGQMRLGLEIRRTAMPEREIMIKQTIRTLYEEVLNEGRLELLDQIAWPEHVEHNPFPHQSQGAEGLKQRASMVRAAFNPHFTIEHVIADRDKVALIRSYQA